MHLDRRNAEGYEDDYVQGFVNLRPVTEATGGNYVLPRSNQHYDFIHQRREQWQAQTAGQKDRPDFYQVLAEERPEIFQEFITAAMEPGDVFLWSDKTIHSACPGVGVGPTEADLMRCAVYGSERPRPSPLRVPSPTSLFRLLRGVCIPCLGIYSCVLMKCPGWCRSLHVAERQGDARGAGAASRSG